MEWRKYRWHEGVDVYFAVLPGRLFFFVYFFFPFNDENSSRANTYYENKIGLGKGVKWSEISGVNRFILEVGVAGSIGVMDGAREQIVVWSVRVAVSGLLSRRKWFIE